MGAACCKDDATPKDETASELLKERNLQTALTVDKTGHDFHDSYDVIKVIAMGSISKISLIKKRGTDKFYALKEIDTTHVKKHLLQELVNEINLLKPLDHPNIIKVYETFELNHRKAIVIDLCSGGDLYKRHPYSENQAAKMIKELLSAVSYLHSRNVIHRDIKYENLMFESDRPDARVKLIDFGLAKSFLRKNDVHMERVGTLYTMSPQVIQGVYTAQADLWSVGVVTFMLLSGSDPPFWGHTPQEIISSVMKAKVAFRGKIWNSRSDESKDFIKGLLKVDPKERLTAAQALKHEWLSKEINLSDVKPSADLLQGVHTNLAMYAESDDFKKLALNIIAKKSSTDEIFELRKVFDAIDEANDGTISFDALKKALTTSGKYTNDEIKTVFDKLNVNHNGVIMYTEFLAAALESQGRIEERRVKEAFELLDVDNSGFISHANLKQILGPTCSDEYISGIITSADVNGDGKISYDEFKQHFEMEQHGMIKEMYEQHPKKQDGESGLLEFDTVIPGGIASIDEPMAGVQVRTIGTGAN